MVNESLRMKIKYLDETTKRTCEALWREAFFEDSDSFLEYYFMEKTKTNRILVLEEDGQIVSMIHKNPYLIKFKNQKVTCDYLVGVATKMEKRGKGYMRTLLKQALLDMEQEKMPFCFLMPADRRIYEPFDFVYVFNQPLWERTDTDWLEDEIMPQSAGIIADWMNCWIQKQYEVFAWRDKAYVERLLRELKSEDGCLKALTKPENPGEITALWATWGIEKKEQRLFYTKEECQEMKQEPAIMARITHLSEFLKAVCLKDEVKEKEVIYRLKVKDRFIENNNGIWDWHVNHRESFLKEADGKFCETGRILELEISELTSWLFGYESSKNVSETAKKEIRCINGVFLDEIV